jgi:hypothetical protein
MKIFISWSGQLSKELGEVITNWIPGVLQFVKPYFTPDDVEKGTRWNNEIARELQESQVGIIVLTKENLLNPWIMFEAGALSKQMDKSRICPILFGIENTDLVGPLVQFQTTNFTETEMGKLVKTINNACGEQKLDDSVLSNVFKMWWPKLETDINSRLQKRKERPDTLLRSDRDLIEEILSLSRLSASRMRAESIGDINPAAFRDLMRSFRELRQAVENQDLPRIEQSMKRLSSPLEYVIERSGITPIERQRIVRRPVIIQKEKESTEEIEVEEEE